MVQPEPVPAQGVPRGMKWIFVAALVAALAMAWAPVHWTVGRFVYDDMFYYLRIAEHIVAGEGVTFDGKAPTNGFHPLWMLICVLLAALASGNLLVHAVLTVAAALHVAQGVAMARLMRRLGVRGRVQLWLVGIYLLNWRTLSVNLCGLETPAAILMMLLVLERVVAAPSDSAPRASFRMGLLLGVAVLCRFDLLMLCAFAAAFMLFDRRGATSGLGRRVSSIAAVAAGILVMLLPWFVFSLAVSGVLLPNSRVAVRLLAGSNYPWGDLAGVLRKLEDQVWAGLWWSWPHSATRPGSGQIVTLSSRKRAIRSVVRIHAGACQTGSPIYSRSRG